MNLRRATPDDATVIARLHVDAWRSAYRGVVPDEFLDSLDYDKRARRFRESLAAGSEETYLALAEENGEPLGILTLGACRDADVDQAITGEIWGIYLAPRHWRKGWGRAILQRAEQMLQSRGYLQATLWVLEGNAQARRFYEAMGFEVDGASKQLNLGAPLQAIRYRKHWHAASDHPGWMAALLWAAPLSLGLLGLVYYWFAVADRYAIFLYGHTTVGIPNPTFSLSTLACKSSPSAWRRAWPLASPG